MREHFYSRVIYTGCDLKEFNRIRDILDSTGIKYKYKTFNRLGGFSGPAGGTIRGNTGSLGVPSDKMYEYEIRVKGIDYEKCKEVCM